MPEWLASSRHVCVRPVTKQQVRAYLISADCQFSLSSLSILLKQTIAHLKDLLHDSILSQVITALSEIEEKESIARER